MTREEAIQWIQLDIDMAKFDPTTGEDAYLNDDAKKVIEAQEMAISALKAQMDGDVISRQAAIDAMCWACGYDCDKSEFVYNAPQDEQVIMCPEHYALSTLPSVQPEQTDCEYCHEDSDRCVRPVENNSHAWLVRRGRTMKLRVGFKGEYCECDILFCPMCGRRLTDG